MKSVTKQRVLTGAVVVGGIVGLAYANKHGVDKDVITAVGAALIALAGTLRSMVLPEKKS